MVTGYCYNAMLMKLIHLYVSHLLQHELSVVRIGKRKIGRGPRRSGVVTISGVCGELWIPRNAEAIPHNHPNPQRSIPGGEIYLGTSVILES